MKIKFATENKHISQEDLDTAIRYASQIAKTFAIRADNSLDKDAFFSVAYFQVWDMHKRYDPNSCSVDFPHWIVSQIKQRIINEVRRKLSYAPESVIKKVEARVKAEEPIEPWLEPPFNLNGGDPGDNEPSENVNASGVGMGKYMIVPPASGYFSSEFAEAEATLNTLWESSGLTDDEKNVLDWYHIRGYTLGEIAKHFSLKTSEVRSILDNGFNKLQKCALGSEYNCVSKTEISPLEEGSGHTLMKLATKKTTPVATKTKLTAEKAITPRNKATGVSEKKKVTPTPIAQDAPKRRGRPSTRQPRAPMTHMGFTDAPKANILEVVVSATAYFKFSDMVQFKISPKMREKNPEKGAFVDQWRGAADLGTTCEIRLDKIGATYLYTVIPEIVANLQAEGGRGIGPYFKTLQKIEDAIVSKFKLKARKPVSPAAAKKEENPIPARRGRPRMERPTTVEINPSKSTSVKGQSDWPLKNSGTTSKPVAKKAITEVKAKGYTPKAEPVATTTKKTPRNMSAPGAVASEEKTKPKIKLKKAS